MQAISQNFLVKETMIMVMMKFRYIMGTSFTK